MYTQKREKWAICQRVSNETVKSLGLDRFLVVRIQLFCFRDFKKLVPLNFVSFLHITDFIKEMFGTVNR